MSLGGCGPQRVADRTLGRCQVAGRCSLFRLRSCGSRGHGDHDSYAGGEASWFITAFVAVVLSFGAWALGVSLVWDWVRLPWAGSGRLLKLGVTVSTLLLVAVTARLLVSGVDLQLSTAALRETEEELVRSQRDLASGSSYDSSSIALVLLDAERSRLDALRRERQITRRSYLRQVDELYGQHIRFLAGEAERGAEAERLRLEGLMHRDP